MYGILDDDDNSYGGLVHNKQEKEDRVCRNRHDEVKKFNELFKAGSILSLVNFSSREWFLKKEKEIGETSLSKKLIFEAGYRNVSTKLGYRKFINVQQVWFRHFTSYSWMGGSDADLDYKKRLKQKQGEI